MFGFRIGSCVAYEDLVYFLCVIHFIYWLKAFNNWIRFGVFQSDDPFSFVIHVCG